MSGVGDVFDPAAILPLALLLKATAVLAVAWALTRVVRSSSAAVRHGIWVAGLAIVAALPVAELWFPAIPVDVPAFLRSPGASAGGRPASLTTPTIATPVVGLDAAGAANAAPGLRLGADPPPADEADAIEWTVALLLLWGAGFLARAVWLLAQLFSVRRVVSNAEPVPAAGEIARTAKNAARALRIRRRVSLRASDAIATPVTCGILRPVVLIPRTSLGWPRERLQVVLLHELAHIRRHDYLSCLFAELVCAAYWPVPLVWMARSAIQAEQEHASDDVVIQAGTPAVDYADHLLAVARSLRPRGGELAGAIGMARAVGLKHRVNTILDARTRRAPLASLQGVATLLALSLCAAPLAALRPAGEMADRDAPREPTLDSAAGAADTTRMEEEALSPSREPLYLWVEVEHGALLGDLALREDLDASGGHVVESVGENGRGESRLSLHLPREDGYFVWLRAAGERSGDELRLSLDGGTIVAGAELEPDGRGDEWDWVRARTADVRPMPLTAGVHTLSVSSASPKVRVDRVLVTTDSNYHPRARGAAPAGFAAAYRWVEMAPGPLAQPLELEVELPSAGQYVVWGRVRGADGEANSFFLSIDGGPEVVWDAPRRSMRDEEGRWVWDPASARELDGREVNPLIFDLTAGRHVIRLRPREERTGIGGLLVTNDLTFRPRGKPAVSPPVEVWLEPESANAGEALRIRRGGGAGSDGYIMAVEEGPGRSDPDDGEPARITFTVPSPGIYTLWGRTVARSDDEDSFWIRVNGGRWVRWNGIPTSRDWRWSAVHDGDADEEPVQLALPAGENTIEIARREGGVRLDRLLLTNDDFFDPLERLAE